MRGSITGRAGRRGWRRSACVVLVLSLVGVAPLIDAQPAAAAAGDITTVAGGGLPSNGIGDKKLATLGLLLAPWGVDETAGNLFISENVGNRVRRVDGATQKISTIGGGGVIGLGDGGPATTGTLASPQGVLADPAGNLYIADTGGNRVRRVATNGVITTIAGSGAVGFNGDGQMADKAKLNAPLRLARDAAGNLFVADAGNSRIRRIDPTGRITTVAGSVPSGQKPVSSTGDGGPALAAQFVPRGIAVDSAGNLYIADIGDSVAVPPAPPRVRRVTPGPDGVVNGGAGEIISTFAGGGSLPPGGAGEGAAATDVALGFPEALALDGAGNLFISTFVDQRVLRVDHAAQTITTVAGNGTLGSAGDGGPATAAQLASPFGVALDGAGNMFVAQLDDSRVRRVDAATHVITTVAGDGTQTFGGDGGPATSAQLSRPADVALSGGAILIADSGNNRVRRVAAGGTITTVAGGGIGDGLAATAATLAGPRGVVADGAGAVLVADCGNQRVRRIAGGTITTYVGGLVPFRCPSGLHLVTAGPSAGTLYVADAGAHQVFQVAPGGGPVTAIAGTGVSGFAGDGGQATAAMLNAPSGVSLDGAGNLLVADTGNNRVRKVSPAGVITTVAGDGTLGIGFDDVAATITPISEPTDMVVEASGSMVIAETGLHRLRRVSPGGIISTVSGNGIPALAGDGGPAGAALLTRPTNIDLDASGAIFFTDQRNRRVRRIEPGTPAPPPSSGCGQVITTDTTLTADLGPCAGNGIVIGADNVTLDLNGHSVFGTDGSDAVGNSAGIRLYARRGVTIKGGTVRGFDAGVLLVGGVGNVVEGLVVRDNIGPLDDDVAILGDGIGLFFSAGNTIIGNTITNNGIYDGIGILGLGADDNLVQDNVVTHTTAGGQPGASGIGIVTTAFYAEDLPREISVHRNRYLSNVVTDNDNSGLSVISNVDGVVQGNIVERNGLAPGAFPGNGIGVQNLARAQTDTRVLVQGNTVTGNGGDGIRVTSSVNDVGGNQVHGNLGSGIHVEGTAATTGHNNAIHDNNAADNSLGPLGYGDLVDFSINQATFVFDCDSNTWLRNIWGSGGFWPDPTELGDSGPVACTTIDGSPALTASAATRAAATSSSTSDRTARASRPPVDDTAFRRGRGPGASP